jgi:hypothetical protein
MQINEGYLDGALNWELRMIGISKGHHNANNLKEISKITVFNIESEFFQTTNIHKNP